MNEYNLIYDAMTGDKESFEKEKAESGVAKRKNSGFMLVQAIFGGNYELVKSMIEEGIEDINGTDYNGATPIYALAYMHYHGHPEGDLEIAKLLLENGADVNKENKYGITALVAAIPSDERFEKHKEFFSLLLDYSPDINKETEARSCRQICKDTHQKSYQLLIEKGLVETDMDKMNIFELAEDGTLEKFKEKFKKEDVNITDKYGHNLMEYTVWGKNWDISKYLVEQGFDPNTPLNSDGENILKFVTYAEYNNFELMKYFLDKGCYSELAFLYIIPDDETIEYQMKVFNLFLKYNPKVSSRNQWRLADAPESVKVILRERGILKD